MAELKMKARALIVLLVASVLITGCDALSSAPTYGGLSVAGFNYTPYNLDRFVVTDKFGNRASGGALLPGAGEGSLSCCYKLKGTEFTVTWNVVDQDEFLKDPYGPLPEIHKTAHVHFPPTKIKGDLGERVLGLHFYPDDHVEFELRTDLGGTRIFYSAIDSWLLKQQGKTFKDTMEDWVAFRRTARIASEGWTKYRLTDTQDLQQYVYYTLLVNPNFDQHPAIQKIIAETRDKPGAFGAAMAELPTPIVEALKQGRAVNPEQRATHG
ncbi:MULTISPECIES: DUF3304 domain-containing protein [unclassified Cupriavidus]|uniref:DUF3304 domain-containing protein n=1 Tax=unclassified Cupriavidus TaxID=2640874 RepID=UPI001CED5702|nr:MULTISPECIES: DUF3304 domain-containing protein [unclassified Cupriavidus]